MSNPSVPDTNPYRSPASDAEQLTRFYRPVPKNAKFRELWRHAYPSPFLLIAVTLMKVLRIDAPPVAGYAYDDQCRIPLSELPENVTARFEDESRDLVSLDFTATLAMTVPVLGDGGSYGLVYLGANNTIAAFCSYVRDNADGSDTVKAKIGLMSKLQSGMIASTTNAERDVDVPEPFHPVYMKGASLRDLVAVHTRRLDKFGQDSAERFTPESLWDTLQHNRDMMLEYHLARGALARLTQQEADAITNRLPPTVLEGESATGRSA